MLCQCMLIVNLSGESNEVVSIKKICYDILKKLIFNGGGA